MRVMDVILLGVLLICSYTDWKKRMIYNVIIFPAILLALVLHLVFSGLDGAFFCLKGILTGLAILFIPFLLGGIGAGDVKLLGVVGAFKGTIFVVGTFLCAALIGGFLSLVVLWRRKLLHKTLRQMGGTLQLLFFSGFCVKSTSWDDHHEAVVLPYGIVIALGTAVCLLSQLVYTGDLL